ncbi:sigma-70 family RNA polymerase sigma factor [Bacillus shivajii]|uniref:sigma-70 family RNA polymerase sigma factor n=1 Tax=Bacillus shivajii TaxID=1983719 RepID=UPI001CF96B77|nr:sigma-70 family RNA polymerase sigma factor [Bacillus shivajii]UCZ52922.1 sigma-70 family RNA polymerase sigma factor [Bacillus shivajii]
MDFSKEKEFEEVCESFMPLVYSLIKKWNLQRDYEEYEQVGRIALYEAWSKHDPEKGPFAAYAKSYVYGKIRHMITSKKRWGDHNVAMEPADMTSIATSVQESEEQRMMLEDWLDRLELKKRERQWAKEALIHGHKPKEIAEMYGVSINSVKYWRKQALKKLAECQSLSEFCRIEGRRTK